MPVNVLLMFGEFFATVDAEELLVVLHFPYERLAETRLQLNQLVA